MESSEGGELIVAKWKPSPDSGSRSQWAVSEGQAYWEQLLADAVVGDDGMLTLPPDVRAVR